VGFPTDRSLWFAKDSALEEAVLSELVSEAKFPGNWEKYRDFYRRDPSECDYWLGIHSQNQSFTIQFPTRRNREVIFGLTGS
jgi:hypothetical protein